ncbi:hypothetical protein D0466_00880 [Peribacillus glennii]|uniref:Uncharacterized protein n=2 Tax=Peribacillus glennii TaxID=2303991 RepID=A0A372LJS3_9BACI|nr:hypothetical protein D0466_00880 [Peribacillus glennii]
MEDAKAELAKIGVTFPNNVGGHNMFANLDHATKKKAEAIMDKMETQLEEQGLELPVRKHQND